MSTTFYPGMDEIMLHMTAQQVLADMEPEDPLFTDEGYLVSEDTCIAEPMKFKSDAEILEFCEQNYLEEDFAIDIHKRVSAYNSYTEEWVHIGFML